MEYYGICIYIYMYNINRKTWFNPKYWRTVNESSQNSKHLPHATQSSKAQSWPTTCSTWRYARKLRIRFCAKVLFLLVHVKDWGSKDAASFENNEFYELSRHSSILLQRKKAHDTVQNYFSVVYIFSFLFYLGNQAWLAGKSTICRWCSQL